MASDLIQRQVMEFIHADVEFTAAKRNLEKKDEALATQETIRCAPNRWHMPAGLSSWPSAGPSKTARRWKKWHASTIG